MREHLIHQALVIGVRLTRRLLTRIARRSVTAEIYLLNAGVDVERLLSEDRRAGAA